MFSGIYFLIIIKLMTICFLINFSFECIYMNPSIYLCIDVACVMCKYNYYEIVANTLVKKKGTVLVQL
jgi:hypothetical protein